MQEEDLIASLTRQVKEEVVENYLTERRLVELQMEDVEAQAEEVRQRGHRTGRRLNRLAHLMVDQEMLNRLIGLLEIPATAFWMTCLEPKFSRGLRFIRVRALTDKSKFRKLVLESYSRFCTWMDKYRTGYESLQAECKAVNRNISSFQKNFDLLAILAFLKSLDTGAIERKRFLGENFTPEELASVDQKLYLRQIAIERFELPAPIHLPKPDHIEEPLGDLAEEVYRKYRAQVKRLMV